MVNVKKSCEIKGDDCIRLMIKNLITTIQMNFVLIPDEATQIDLKIVVIIFFTINLSHHSNSSAAPL